MKDFLLTIVIEGLEDKYTTLLSRGKSLLTVSLHWLRLSVAIPLSVSLYWHFISDCKVLKNRKFVGALPEQTVRQKPKPFIIEMDRYDMYEADIVVLQVSCNLRGKLHYWLARLLSALLVKLICGVGVPCVQE